MYLITEYWHWLAIITISTWISFFVGFYIKNKYGTDHPSKTGKFFEFIFSYGLDMPCNWFLTFFPCFEFPDKITELVTHRLKRYKSYNPLANWAYLSTRKKYHYKLSVIVCNQLNKADKNHC